MKKSLEKDWIVIAGQLVDSTKGGGFEFFGPFTEREAVAARKAMLDVRDEEHLVLAVQLLRYVRPKPT